MTDMEIGLVKRFLGWLSPSLRGRIVILADRGSAKTELSEAIAVLWVWASETEAPSLEVWMPIWTQRHRSEGFWNKKSEEAA